MLYLSKGILDVPMSSSEVRVSRCGREYILTDRLAAVWRAGRLIPKRVQTAAWRDIKWLCRLGLAEATDESGPLALYRLLIACIICPAPPSASFRLLNNQERETLHWIKQAGLRLTMAELVRLRELGLTPTPLLIGEQNRQRLTESIYTPESIFDTILENEMEHSHARDGAVRAVLGLLRKKRLFLL